MRKMTIKLGLEKVSELKKAELVKALATK
ncbi:MAG: hypothetical protein F6K11_35270 [Leptolyngbya sp. SIO3F4]|nr:hypothetical protein [Leptolyngbya sp. SIO3F4]